MTDTDLPLRCQLGDCGNRAALTVTLEVPVDWSESREYRVVALEVAVCGDCAHELEDHGRTLLAARMQYGRLHEKTEDRARLRTQLTAIVETIGPPFEPVHGSVFARWLSRLDKPTAQAAWRLLGDVKRTALEGTWAAAGRRATSSPQVDCGPAARAVPIEVARFRRRVLVPPMQPSPPPAAPPLDPSPRGGDDAA